MKPEMRMFFFLFLIFAIGCPPAVDDPKEFDNGVLSFSYPGNWHVENKGTTILVEERLFLGNIAGSTTILFEIDAEKSEVASYEQERKVVAKIGAKNIQGEMSFDWVEGDFESRYQFLEGSHPINIFVKGYSKKIKKAEPGIRLVLESLKVAE